ncbi:hypothetical protein D4L85_31600 [Chryseolinea soli]|uniref:Uncharacterized protein n=1 Tax=Chryseolinea soli TaxID=2321403 RepID=A0A385SUG5_9BACT|nr:hypothetical protein D4L85_31600 [Chryseolinea soli]
MKATLQLSCSGCPTLKSKRKKGGKDQSIKTGGARSRDNEADQQVTSILEGTESVTSGGNVLNRKEGSMNK